jgi:hypothetical protein
MKVVPQVHFPGIKLEHLFKENCQEVDRMKRNKKTVIIAHEELTPLTEHILTKMGKEGSMIRQRLKSFYRERNLVKETGLEQHLEGHLLEAASQ